MQNTTTRVANRNRHVRSKALQPYPEVAEEKRARLVKALQNVLPVDHVGRSFHLGFVITQQDADDINESEDGRLAYLVRSVVFFDVFIVFAFGRCSYRGSSQSFNSFTLPPIQPSFEWEGTKMSLS